MKVGMLKSLDCISDRKLDAKLLLQVHDEIIFSVAKNDEKSAITCIKEALESVVCWPFDLKVSIKSGKSWSDITK